MYVVVFCSILDLSSIIKKELTINKVFTSLLWVKLSFPQIYILEA